MEATPSFGSTSDDGSYDIPPGPLTPSTSPSFRPVQTGIVVEKHLAEYLSDVVVSKDDFAPDSTALRSPPFITQRICFIGAGYVGGPTAAIIALHNPTIHVDVLDRDDSRIRSWKSSHLPLHEPGLDQVVRLARDGGILEENSTSAHKARRSPSERAPNLFFTTDSKQSLSRADMIFLAVNTPTKTFGQGAGRATNMNAIDGAVRDIATFAKDGVIIVEKSTVPCGTAQRIDSRLRSLRPEMRFEVLSNPEFLSEGCAITDLQRPDRVLIGSSQTLSGMAAASALANLYSAWVPKSKIAQVNTWSSELSKLVANSMLAQRISSINSISAICEATGADINEIARSIGLDPRIGPKFLKAGLGFGGSCFRKDIASLTYLAESLDLPEVAQYWAQVNSINQLQRGRFTNKVIKQLDENLVGKKITLLGFAFKKDTGDTRESLAVDVIAQLLEERPAEIAIFDPYCKEDDIQRELSPVIYGPDDKGNSNVTVCENIYEACAKADAIMIITDCDQFKCLQSAAVIAAMPTHHLSALSEADRLVSSDHSFVLKSLPDCAPDCKQCERHSRDAISSQAIVDWRRIAGGMSEPRWVFDGRCILDVVVMRELGFRVQSIGRQYL